MNTSIATRAPTLPGLLPDVEALRLAEGFRAQEQDGQMVLARMPTPDEKETLARRTAEIAIVLEPVGSDRMRQAEASEIIAGLLVGYGYARGDKAAAQTVAVYVKHLDMLPVFAIRAACEDVKAGRVYDIDARTGNRKPISPDKEPSTVRLRQVAEKHVDALLAEKWKFDRVLRAKRALPPPLDEAGRVRMAAKLIGLKEDLQAADAEEDLEREAAAARLAERQNASRDDMILAEYKQLGIEPIYAANGILVSPSLAKMTGALVNRVDRKPQADHEM